MRVLVGVAALLVCVLGFITPTSCLADTGVQVSPAQAQEEAELLDIPEDLDIDVAGFFRALFDDDDDDDDTQGRESRQLDVGDGSGDGSDSASVAASTAGAAAAEESSLDTDENRAVSDPATIAKYGNFMDMFYRKLNSELRKQGDTMQVSLSKAKAGKGGNKRKSKKSKKKNNKNKKSGGQNANKGSKKKSGDSKQNSKNKKKKSRSRHPKDLKLDGSDKDFEHVEETIATNLAEEDDEDNSGDERDIEIVLVAEDVPKWRRKRSVEEEEELTGDDETEAVDAVESGRESRDRKFGLGMAGRRAQQKKGVKSNNSPAVRAARPGRGGGGKRKKAAASTNSKNKNSAVNKKRNAAAKKKNKAANKKRKNGKNNKRGANKKNKSKVGNLRNKVKRRGKNGKHSMNRTQNSPRELALTISSEYVEEKNLNKKKLSTKATVSGYSSLIRRGSVKITQSPNSQKISSDFTIGPVEIEFSRQFGKGERRTARSSATSISGSVVIEVTKTGKAKVAKLRLTPPANVRVSGSLSRDSNKKKGKQEKMLKTSIKRVSPKISKRIKSAARAVLLTTSGIVRNA